MSNNKNYNLDVSRTAANGWDEFILSGEAEPLHMYHTTRWAIRLNELLAYEPIYFVLKREGVPCLAMVGFVDRGLILVPGDHVKNIARKMRTLAYRCGVMKKPLIWFGQPIQFAAADDEAYDQLAQRLIDYLRDNRLALGRGEWPVTKSASLPEEWEVKKWATYKVDLKPSEDEIFQAFKSSAKKEIRKAANRGLTVRKVNNLDELAEYYRFAEECSKRYNKKLFGFADFRTMWVHLRRGGYFETFVASYKGEMVAGLSVWGDKYNLMEIGSFQSEDCYRLKLGGADVVKWAAIQWGKSVAALQFDLAGVNPSPSDSKEAGIKSFKEKWSSDLREYLIIKER